MQKYYKWECWHNRPKEMVSGFDWRLFKRLRWWQKTIFIPLWLGINAFGIIGYLLWWITLPFAFLHEVLSSL